MHALELIAAHGMNQALRNSRDKVQLTKNNCKRLLLHGLYLLPVVGLPIPSIMCQHVKHPHSWALRNIFAHVQPSHLCAKRSFEVLCGTWKRGPLSSSTTRAGVASKLPHVMGGGCSGPGVNAGVATLS